VKGSRLKAKGTTLKECDVDRIASTVLSGPDPINKVQKELLT
jgi:hypothetical protein